MKNLVGKNVVVSVSGDKISGMMIKNLEGKIIIKQNDNLLLVNKNKISFVMFKESDVKINTDVSVKSGLCVISCTTNEGVDMERYYITNEFKPDDVEILCNTFDMKNGTFKVKNLGDLFSLPPKFIENILSGTVYGD